MDLQVQLKLVLCKDVGLILNLNFLLMLKFHLQGLRLILLGPLLVVLRLINRQLSVLKNSLSKFMHVTILSYVFGSTGTAVKD